VAGTPLAVFTSENVTEPTLEEAVTR